MSRKEPVDCSARPLTQVSGKAGPLAFTISLPDGFAPDPIYTDIGYMDVKPDGTFDFNAPIVVIKYTATPPKTLDDVVSNIISLQYKIKRADTIDHGFIVVAGLPQRSRRVELFWLVRDQALHCVASQANDEGREIGDAASALLEKICLSLAVT